VAPLSPTRQAAALFRQTFSTDPVAGASAPGRLNLIGEHTDYNGGPVLPVALQRRTTVVVAPAEGWHLVSTVDGIRHEADIEGPLPHNWTAYLVGVVRELRAADAAPRGAHVAVGSSVPIGAGLSSSAAITVAAAKALSLLAGKRLAAAELVDVASRAEHEQVGVHGGRMDQTIAVYAKPGSALMFDTATGAREMVPMPGRIWVVETGVEHRLTGGELNARRQECEQALALLRGRWPSLEFLAALPQSALTDVAQLLPDKLLRRVRHIVTETARVHAAVRALAAGEFRELGRLLVEGHESLRLDYESSCEEADVIVRSAASHGAYGARLTGAGWGGAVIMLAPQAGEAAAVRGVSREFEAAFGRAPVIWSTAAAAGARAESVAR
jgi:galactokinase